MANNHLREPIQLKSSVKTVRIDTENGDTLLTLRIPATHIALAARLAIMQRIVFDTTFTPESVQDAEQRA